MTDSTYELPDRRGRRRRWTAVDTTMLQLVRLVMDDEWNAREAGATLSELVGEEEAVLARIGAKVRKAHFDRSSAISERAVATVEAATPSYGIDAAAESDSGDSSERDPAPAA